MTDMTEHIDSQGRLHVPKTVALDPDLVRPGWTPYWVNTNLTRNPQSVVIYKREEGSSQSPEAINVVRCPAVSPGQPPVRASDQER